MIAVALSGCAALLDHRAEAREQVSTEMTPPKGAFVEVNGRRVHAVVRGDGPDLVMIHGASGNLRDFTFDLMDRLTDDFRVIAFDRPGLGWSDRQEGIEQSPLAQADVLRAAAAQLDVENPIVLGHSYGGAVALGWALRAPQDTAALVLVAPASHPWPGDLGVWYRLADTAIGRGMVLPLVSAFAPRGRAEAVVERIFEPDPVPEGYTGHIGLDLSLRRSQLAANVVQINALRAYVEEMHVDYPTLDLPVEILHGTADTTVGIALHSERLLTDLPDANLVRLDGVGHMPHHARPGETVAAIQRAARRAGLRD